MAFRSASSDYQDADTAAPAKPTGTVENDTVILIANCGGSTTATFTWPTGFSATIDTVATGAGGYDRTIAWAWKRAGASEPSTYSVTSSITGTLSVVALSYEGMAVSPVDDFDEGFTNTAAGSPLTVTPAGLVTTVANAIVLWVCAPNYQISNNTPAPGTTVVTQPSGHTTRITQMGDYAAIVVSDITQASAGATGSLAGTAENNQGQNGTWCAFSIALQPAAGGGTVNTSTLTDTVALADAVVESVIRGSVSSDLLIIADAFFLWRYLTRELQDSIVVTEGALETYTTINIHVIDELTISDEVVAWFRRFRLLEDNITVTDDLIASVIGYLIYVSVLTSQLAITDEALPDRYFSRLLDSTLLTDDQTTRAVFVTRDLLDSVEVIDQGLTALQRFILLTDTLSMDDSLSSIFVSPVTNNPMIVIGFDQPRIELGGYGL